jgi:hypothetical protein
MYNNFFPYLVLRACPIRCRCRIQRRCLRAGVVVRFRTEREVHNAALASLICTWSHRPEPVLKGECKRRAIASARVSHPCALVRALAHCPQRSSQVAQY